MKRKSMMVLFAALLTFGGAVYAQEAETVQEAADTQEADAAGLSDDWKDYQIQIDDQVYSFPMMYEDFTALGWETDESDELSEYQIEVDGQVYALPVPVSVLAADGWEIDANDSEETIKAGSSGWVTLRKGGQEIRDLAYNGESYATIPENCRRDRPRQARDECPGTASRRNCGGNERGGFSGGAGRSRHFL